MLMQYLYIHEVFAIYYMVIINLDWQDGIHFSRLRLSDFCTSASFWKPDSWPWERGWCLSFAKRLLPSIINATWRGISPHFNTLLKKSRMRLLCWFPSLAQNIFHRKTRQKYQQITFYCTLYIFFEMSTRRRASTFTNWISFAHFHFWYFTFLIL
jgi:hypothetical protein